MYPLKQPSTFEEFIDNSYYYRGKLIDEFCHIEMELERYLVRYFLHTKPERRELKNLIFDRMTFDSKRTAFKAMLDKKAVENGFVKTKTNSYLHNNLINEIRLLNDQRNYFAHYYLAIPLNVTEYVIMLAEYRDSVKVHKYTFEKYNTIIERIKAVVKEIEILRGE